LNRVGVPLRVRIGLNTGEVAWQGDQLSGESVHAAARVCAASSGGQILVSDVTRQLAGTVADVSFHDTGEHQLKGKAERVQLWRALRVVAGARGALRSSGLEAPETWEAPPTPLITPTLPAWLMLTVGSL